MRLPFLLLLVVAAAVAGEALPPLLVKLPPGEQPTEVRRLEVAAQVRGLLAEVTTTLAIANPNPRQLAGELEFPLPDGAAVCGYALDIDGRLVDGVVVPQEQARAVLEAESRRRVDPGLVEHVRGNLFRTRIFPLPPGGVRTLAVTWTVPLSVRGAEAALRLPLPRIRLPELVLRLDISAGEAVPELGGFGDLQLTAWRSGHRAEARFSDILPGDDLLVRLPRLPERLVEIEERGGERFALVSVLEPSQDLLRHVPPRRLAVAWDASASLDAAAARRGRAALVALIRACPGLILDVVPFHIRPEPARSFGDPAELDRWLEGLANDGATGLAALDLRRAALPSPEAAGWLLLSDGLGTWGDGLPASGDAPVTCLAASAVRDDAVLRLLAARSGGAVLDLTTMTAEQAAAQVLAPGRSAPRVDAPAGVLDEVQIDQRGGRALVLARLRGAGRISLVWPEVPALAVDLDPSRAVAGGTIARGWAGARAAELAVFPEANRAALLSLGRAYGVVTAGTSLLVLENLDQHLRYGIEPPASRPDLQQAWAVRMKQRADQRQDREAAHQRELQAMWAERVRWWEGKNRPLPAKPEPVAAAAPAAPQASTLASAAERRVAEDAPDPKGREDAADITVMGHGMFGSRSGGRRAGGSAGGGSSPVAERNSIAIAGWNPDTPWMRPLRAAPAGGAYAAWLAQREALPANPAAVLDCAGFILAQDRAAGLRVLSNLAEMRLDDPALLRVLAWRLQDAGEVDIAVALLRRVLRLRPEEPQSYRDLALALALRWEGGHRAADAEEALALLWRVADRRPMETAELGEGGIVEGNWRRFPQCEVIALEEFNRLAERCAGTAVAVPAIDPGLRRNLACDLRVVMAWDADATDIDLHVRQPDQEIAFYGRNRTSAGGLVSPDCTQGYGPEEYLIRQAPHGAYHVLARYFGSRQTGLLGPATVTATVFTDWGRPTERSQRLTMRLDRQGDEIPIGSVQVGDGAAPIASSLTRASAAALARGMAQAEVERILGPPERRDGGGVSVLVYRLAGGSTLRVGLAPELVWVREVVDGAERDLLR